MPHLIEEVFGQGCDLYKLLKCNADATKAQLRKGYYRAALKVHPDKNTDNDTTRQFQAISMAYQILQDETLRQEYDETGAIPDSNDNDNDDKDMSGSDAWKSYFDVIFGKVTTSKIDSFAAKYKCSDEERRDVLREFKSRQGNLVKMLDFVMLSEPRDAIRWAEDYIRPAFYNSNNDNSNSNAADSDSNSNDDTVTGKDKKDAAAWKSTMEKTLSKLQKQVEKENQKLSAAAANDKGDDDNSMNEDETETEGEEEDGEESPQKKSSNKKPQQASSGKITNTSSSKKSVSAKKGKPVQAKHAKNKKTNAKNNSNNNNKQVGSSSSMDDLIAQIQNKRRGGGGGASSAWADLGARYGVAASNNDDPLNDEDFAKIQAGLGNHKKKNNKKGQQR